MRASFGGLCRSFVSRRPGRGVRPWPGAPRCWPRLRPVPGFFCRSLLLPKAAFDNTARLERSLASSSSSLSFRTRSNSMVLSRWRRPLTAAGSSGRSASLASSSCFLMSDFVRAMRRWKASLDCASMMSIWSWYPASSPRSSLASSVSRRTVALRPCDHSSSRRSRPFSRFC